MTDTPIRYLTVKEVAEALSVSEWTVRQWCQADKVPGAQKFGRRWKIPASYLADPDQLMLDGIDKLDPEVDYDPRDDWAADYEKGI